MPLLCCHAPDCPAERQLSEPLPLRELLHQGCARCALWFCRDHQDWPTLFPDLHRRQCRQVKLFDSEGGLELFQVDYLPKHSSVGIRTTARFSPGAVLLSEDPIVTCPVTALDPGRVPTVLRAGYGFNSLARASLFADDPFHFAGAPHLVGVTDSARMRLSNHLEFLLNEPGDAQAKFGRERAGGTRHEDEESTVRFLAHMIMDGTLAVPSLHLPDRADHYSLFDLIGRINHSEVPNVRLVSVGGTPRAALVSLAEIPVGQELLVDYRSLDHLVNVRELMTDNRIKSEFRDIRRVRNSTIIPGRKNHQHRRKTGIALPLQDLPFECRAPCCSLFPCTLRPDPTAFIVRPLPNASSLVAKLPPPPASDDKRDSKRRTATSTPEARTLELRTRWYAAFRSLLEDRDCTAETCDLLVSLVPDPSPAEPSCDPESVLDPSTFDPISFTFLRHVLLLLKLDLLRAAEKRSVWTDSALLDQVRNLVSFLHKLGLPDSYPPETALLSLLEPSTERVVCRIALVLQLALVAMGETPERASKRTDLSRIDPKTLPVFSIYPGGCLTRAGEVAVHNPFDLEFW